MILLTGGSGLLGTELQKYIKCYAPSHKKLNINSRLSCARLALVKKFKLIIHGAAYTNVEKAEIEKEKCFKTNVEGTMNLLVVFPNTPFVYISSEYAYKPVNFYAETKRAGEMAVEAYAKHHLIIRTLFKPKPFPYEKAFYNQYTQGDYVDVIAPLIVKEIKKWDKKTSKTVYVGTGRKTILELAERTKPTIPACSVDEVKNVRLPKDYI